MIENLTFKGYSWRSGAPKWSSPIHTTDDHRQNVRAIFQDWKWLKKPSIKITLMTWMMHSWWLKLLASQLRKLKSSSTIHIDLDQLTSISGVLSFNIRDDNRPNHREIVLYRQTVSLSMLNLLLTTCTCPILVQPKLGWNPIQSDQFQLGSITKQGPNIHIPIYLERYLGFSTKMRALRATLKQVIKFRVSCTTCRNYISPQLSQDTWGIIKLRPHLLPSFVLRNNAPMLII